MSYGARYPDLKILRTTIRGLARTTGKLPHSAIGEILFMDGARTVALIEREPSVEGAEPTHTGEFYFVPRI
jgi:hypothetical protein